MGVVVLVFVVLKVMIDEVAMRYPPLTHSLGWSYSMDRPAPPNECS